MRRLLDCDFFLGEEDPSDANGASGDPGRLRVFAGPRGIVIADARVRVDEGVRVRHGEAFATSAGIEFVFYRERDGASRAVCRELDMRFVVRGARYDASVSYSLRPECAANGIQ